MKVKIYQYFWVTALICVLWGYLSPLFLTDTMLDINIYDTYFVVAQLHVCILLAIFYSVIGLAYFLCRNRRLISALTVLHTVVTIGGFIAYLILINIARQTYDSHSLFDSTQEIQNTGIVIILLLVALVQLLLPVNMVTALLREMQKDKNI